MKSIYKKKKWVVNRQRAVLADIYDLTQDAPAIVIPATMDKNLDSSAQQLEELLVELATTLEQSMHLWDENFDQ